jgi:hypothetical protein
VSQPNDASNLPKVYKVSKIPEKQTAAIPMKKTNSAIIARNALSIKKSVNVQVEEN